MQELKAVSKWDTSLSVVFDPVSLRVFLRTKRNPQIRYLDFSALDISFGSPVMMLDTHTGDAGDLADDLLKYSHQLTFEQSKIMTENTWQVDVSPLFVDAILTGFEGSTARKTIRLRLKTRSFIQSTTLPSCHRC
jgi:hypothetical protein